ncbi:hypothetical protein HPB47_001745, partial [Ixodes persulcatus]
MFRKALRYSPKMENGNLPVCRRLAESGAREAWKRNVGRAGWTPSDGTVLCSDHFTADSVDCQKFRSAFGMPAMMPRLKQDAMPTLFGICRAPPTTPRDEERRETDQRPPGTASKYLQVALKPWSREAKVQTLPRGGVHT